MSRRQMNDNMSRDRNGGNGDPHDSRSRSRSPFLGVRFTSQRIMISVPNTPHNTRLIMNVVNQASWGNGYVPGTAAASRNNVASPAVGAPVQVPATEEEDMPDAPVARQR